MPCAVQTRPPWPASAGARGSPSRVRTFDGTPIDVSVALPPAPASGSRRALPAHRDLPRVGRQQGAAVRRRRAEVAQGGLRRLQHDRPRLARELRHAGLAHRAPELGHVRERRHPHHGPPLRGPRRAVPHGRARRRRRGGPAAHRRRGRVLRRDGVVVAGRAQRPHDAPRRDGWCRGAARTARRCTSRPPRRRRWPPTSSTRSSRTGARWTTPPGRRTSVPRGAARVGVQKAAVMNGFLRSARSRAATRARRCSRSARPRTAPGPTTRCGRDLEQALETHGAYNVPDGQAPAPMLMSDGFSDDFARRGRVGQALQPDPHGPPADAGGDVLRRRGARAQPGQGRRRRRARRVAGRLDALLRAAARGRRRRRACGCGASPVRRPRRRAARRSFADWSRISSGEVRLTTRRPQTVAASGGLYGDRFSAPDGSACATSPAADNPRTANYRVGRGDRCGLRRVGVGDAAAAPRRHRAQRPARGPSAGRRPGWAADAGRARAAAPARGRPGRGAGAAAAPERLARRRRACPEARAAARRRPLQPPQRAVARRRGPAPDPGPRAAAAGPGDAGPRRVGRARCKPPLRRYLPPGYTAARDFAGETTGIPEGFGPPGVAGR